MNRLLVLILFLIPEVVFTQTKIDVSDNRMEERRQLEKVLEESLHKDILNPWYPRAIDERDGGFLTQFTFDFKPTDKQDKMIVTQARHIWVNAKAYERYRKPWYKRGAENGFYFLKHKMWDKTNGGFYTLTDKQGVAKKTGVVEKTAYGNAFAIYGLAAYYHAFGDTSALHLAIEGFHWLEKHSHDSLFKGYFQDMKLDGTPLVRTSETAVTSSLGYKDQNSSIHLLEAFIELYKVWPNPLLEERLNEMLLLIRDKMVHPKGYLQLFFQRDWTPVTVRNESRESIIKNHGLDYVSFGHDIETAYLMLEASKALGYRQDSITFRKSKLMVDHVLKNGWDNAAGGIYDEGYYFKEDNHITIIKDTKNWWAQAETLNTCLIMADFYPNDVLNYFEKFKKQWKYIQEYLIDHKYGGWYEGGLDKQPQFRTALKGHNWKATYHTSRAMMNCINRLPD